MLSIRSLFRHGDALIPSVGALLYALTGWAGGLAILIMATHPLWLAAGTLMLAHGMVIAAYLLHECAHQAMFKKREHNALLGGLLTWITGSSYNRYEQIRKKHMRHHVDNADIVAVDYRSWLLRHPLCLRFMRALEWAYIPAVELVLHGMMVVLPFTVESRHGDRVRTLGVLLVRGGLFITLAWHAPLAAALYTLAYMLFLTVLRFMDAFQHNYDFFMTLDGGDGSPYKGDRDYEQSHTFSNPVSMSHPLLNWFTLNFCYHNAHHEKPTVPWYRLPRLHEELFGQDRAQVIAFREQLKAFHNQRIPRILSLEDESQNFREEMAQGTAVGADGVSFLTAL